MVYVDVNYSFERLQSPAEAGADKGGVNRRNLVSTPSEPLVETQMNAHIRTSTRNAKSEDPKGCEGLVFLPIELKIVAAALGHGTFIAQIVNLAPTRRQAAKKVDSFEGIAHLLFHEKPLVPVESFDFSAGNK